MRPSVLLFAVALAATGCRKRNANSDQPTVARPVAVDAAVGASRSASKGEDCDALYYGIGRSADHAAAYACFVASKDVLRVVTMNLSEDGTTTDLALVRAWLATEQSFPAEHETLEKAIERRARGEKVDLEFCKDVAFATPNLGYCAAIDAAIASEGQRVQAQRTRALLPVSSHAAFDRMQEAYARFERAEGDRKYAEYETGTIRGLAFGGQQDYVRERHGRRLAALESGNAVGVDLDEAAQDRALNVRYSKERDGFRQALNAELSRPTGEFSPETKSQYEHCIATLRDAQLAWIRYRDAWVTLAGTLEASGRSIGTKAAVSAWLTKSRTEELDFDPVAPSEAR